MNKNISTHRKSQNARGILMLFTSALAALVYSAGASADNAETRLAKRFYVSPMVSRIFADSDRLAKDGNGGILAFGKQLDDQINFELYLLGAQYDVKSESGSAKVKGIAAAASIFPFAKRESALGTWLGGAYALAGVGYGDGDSDAVTVPSSDQKRYLYEVGIGYLLPLFGATSLRLDARYRFDDLVKGYDGTADGDKGGFVEPVVSLGLLIPIGKVAEPTVPPPAQVVPVEPPADTDGDGVVDASDQCVNSAAGIQVDEKGCALPLPCKASAPRQKMDLSGCTAGDVVVLRGVNFEFNEVTLTSDAKLLLDEVVSSLKTRSDIQVELDGYTDSKGSDAYNQTLSELRAQSVVDYLIENGIDGSRLAAKGFGEGQAVADNEAEAGRELNRRVELRVTASDAPAPVTPSAEAPPSSDTGSAGSASSPDIAL